MLLSLLFCLFYLLKGVESLTDDGIDNINRRGGLNVTSVIISKGIYKSLSSGCGGLESKKDNEGIATFTIPESKLLGNVKRTDFEEIQLLKVKYNKTKFIIKSFHEMRESDPVTYTFQLQTTTLKITHNLRKKYIEKISREGLDLTLKFIGWKRTIPIAITPLDPQVHKGKDLEKFEVIRTKQKNKDVITALRMQRSAFVPYEYFGMNNRIIITKIETPFTVTQIKMEKQKKQYSKVDPIGHYYYLTPMGHDANKMLSDFYDSEIFFTLTGSRIRYDYYGSVLEKWVFKYTTAVKVNGVLLAEVGLEDSLGNFSDRVFKYADGDKKQISFELLEKEYLRFEPGNITK